MNKISVFIKEPGEPAYKDTIENTLVALQEIVGGYIETVTVASDLVFIINEEGRLMGLEPNCEVNTRFGDVDFCGTIIMAGIDGEEFTDVPLNEADAKRLFPMFFEE